MFSFNIFIPLFFFFFLYLVIQIIKENLFFIYLVQLKEYRLDRIKAHFKTLSGKNQIKNYFNLLKWKRFYHPKFTIRSCLIFILVFLAQYNFFFFFLRFSFSFFKEFSNNTLFLLLLTVYLLNLTIPLLVFFFSFLTFLLLWPIKKAIVFLAEKKIKKMENLLIIGVTGSYGKTAVKEITSFLLSGFFNTLKTPFNCNTQIGIAFLILRKLRKNHEVFVVEMGAYKKGEIEAICKMVKPKIGILTGIDDQHLELFGSINKTQWAKYELIKALPKGGLAVFNEKNYYNQRLFKATKKDKVFYGKKRIRFKTKLAGDWQQQNIQAALAVCDFLKLPRGKVFGQLAKLEVPVLTLEVKRGIRGVIVINDSYSVNPTGFLAAMDLLKKTPAKKKILITPGIIELGEASDRIHKEIGQKASRICNKIFLTKPDFKESIKKGVVKNKQDDFVEVEKDEVELLEKLKPFLEKRTAILLEGRLPAYLVKKLCRT